MIELTNEMFEAFLAAAQPSRMWADGDPDWAAGLTSVLAIVERDYRVSKRKGPLAPPCADEGPDGYRCERNSHRGGRHAASGIGPRAGELVTW